MTDHTVFKLTQPGTFSDPLTEVLRNGARALLTQAVEAEVAAFLDSHAEERTEDGRRRLVRHGHLPEREILTGIGAVAVRCPRVRDRAGQGEARIRFTSAMLPPYVRRSKSLEVLIPILYLKGISTGDFAAALGALLGPDAGGLSASTIARLKDAWVEEHACWCKRDLSAKRYVYFWADGIYVQARLEDDAQCLLVIIGATPEGKKELVGLVDGVRESTQSWKELLLDLRRRGLAMGPQLAVADGALGFWKAIEEVWPKTRAQRCWVHKTANVLNKLPQSLTVILKEAIEVISPQAKLKQIELVEQLTPVFYQTNADKDMLYQAVLNLLSNAVKYTPEGGRITVQTLVDEAKKTVITKISDTGVGIPPKDLPFVFDKFYRAEANNKMAKGTGLGLSLVRHIIETVHHGRIFVESQVGQGTTFGFELDLCE